MFKSPLMVALCSFLYLTPTHASVKRFDNIHFELNKNLGSVSFDQALIKDTYSTITYRATALETGYEDGVVSFENNELKAQLAADAKNIFEAITYVNFSSRSLVLDDEAFSTQLSHLDFALGDGIQKIEGVDLRCLLKSEQPETLKSCLFNFNLQMDAITIDPSSFKTVQQIVPDSLQKAAQKKKSWKFESLKAQTSSNSFSLEFKIKFLFKFKIRVLGDLIDNSDTSEIGFKINSAKFSVIPITKLLLKAVEFADIANTRVSGNTIFLKLL